MPHALVFSCSPAGFFSTAALLVFDPMRLIGVQLLNRALDYGGAFVPAFFSHCALAVEGRGD